MVGLSALESWSRSSCDGGIVARSPDRATWIRIRPRVAVATAPRHGLERLIAEVYGPSARASNESVTAEVTFEGEFAAVASAEVDSLESPTGCTVAVAGDEPCLCIEVVGTDHRAHAIALLDSLAVGLGAFRKRWFSYAPPDGWFGMRRAGHSVWLHPAYPRVAARITVFDARAVASTPAERLDRFLFIRLPEGFVGLEPLVVEDITSSSGLVGRLRRAAGRDGERRALRVAVVFTDDRFSYLAHFDGPNEPEIESQFRELLSTFEPIPRPRMWRAETNRSAS